jgi:chromosome partitioning protein
VLCRWREEWRERLTRNPNPDLALPPGRIEPIGYIVLQHQVRLDRPTKAYDKWIAQIPGAFREAVLDQRDEAGVAVGDDPWCLALPKHYRSLMPLAQDARKPIFLLKPADGAIGSH